MADSRQPKPPEPRSWGELLNGYRATFGSRAGEHLVARPQPQVHYTRSVQGICPLAEISHPLYAVGAQEHTITCRCLHAVARSPPPDAHDGSAQRAAWHGWGDTSLLQEDGCAGAPHPRGARKERDGKRQLPAPRPKDGRDGLFGLLQCTEAGGVDSWIGHMQIDPTKGKRSVPVPTDPKRSGGFGSLLAQTAPGSPADDAWMGNMLVDPAGGKAKAADPSSLRGRADLFAVLQQRALREPAAPNSDAWVGNRLIQPGKGKKPAVSDVPLEALNDHLHAATFKGPPPADGCYSDLPPVGKRPLPPPSDAAGFVTAAQALAIEVPLPPGTIVGSGKGHGRAAVPDPFHHAGTRHVDLYSLMTFKQPSEAEAASMSTAWNDGRHTRKRPPPPNAAAAQPAGGADQLAWAPSRGMRFVPLGGIAQEKGVTLDAILLNRAQAKLTGGGPSGSGSSGGGAGLAAAPKQRAAAGKAEKSGGAGASKAGSRPGKAR